MMPNIFSFFIYRLFAINAGEDVNRAHQLALVGSLMKNPLFGAVLINTVARQEVRTSAPSAPPPAVTAPPSASEPGSKTIEMPMLRSTQRTPRYLRDVLPKLEGEHFPRPVIHEHSVPTADPGLVLEQSPPPGTPVIPTDTEVTLIVTPGKGKISSSRKSRDAGNLSQSV